MADIGGANRKGETLTVNSGNGYTLTTTATDGHGYSLQINGVLGASKYGYYIYSNSIQVNSPLQRIHSDNASSTADLSQHINDGTGTNHYIEQSGVLASSRYALHVYSNGIQINSPLSLIHSDNSSSTANLVHHINDGTGSNTYIEQNGVLASGKRGLFVYTNSAQVNGNLARFENGNASSTTQMVQLINAATAGTTLYIQNTVTTSGVPFFLDGNTSSENGVILIDNDVDGDNTRRCVLNAKEASGSGTYAFNRNLASASTDGPVFMIQNLNIGDDQDVFRINNSGLGSAILLSQSVNSANACYGIRMNLANAGAGLEYAFRFDGSEIVVAAVGGAQSHKVRVSIAGTDFFIPCHTA